MSAPKGDLRRGSGVETVVRTVRTDIEAGRYRHGEMLPPVRALAAELGTSDASVSRALQQLAAAGLVVTQPRVGARVNYPGPDQGPAAAARRRPSVILVGGYAGSGKTETGRILARATGWAMLDKDSITRPVVEAMLRHADHSPHDRESAFYLDTVRPAEYESLREVALENVACGNSVIVSAPFARELNDPAWCARTAADYDAHEAQVRALWVRCDEESMQRYLRRRGAARDERKLAHWADYAAGLDMHYTPALPHAIVQNSITDPPLQAQIETVLDQWGLRSVTSARA